VSLERRRRPMEYAVVEDWVPPSEERIEMD
jgi:hypothetical protein